MPIPGQAWPLNLKVAACFLHATAISSGIFRLAYRWHISRFGWEDAWALLALLTDISCLVCSWLQQSASPDPSNTELVLDLVAVISLTSVLWEARLSMITSVIRITNPRASTRRLSYTIAVAFGMMWIGMLTLKLYHCGALLCNITHAIAISQLATDVVSDALLVAMPVFFLRGIQISRGQRVLLASSFASSICITIISIPHSILLFLPVSSTSLLMAHLKAALSVIICNLLVILTFVYRVLHKVDVDLGGTSMGSVQLTTVIPGQWSLGGTPTGSVQLATVIPGQWSLEGGSCPASSHCNSSSRT